MKHIYSNSLSLLSTVLAGIVLIAGSFFLTGSKQNHAKSEPVTATPAMVETIELAIDEDPGLKLYREAATRNAVTDFYVEETDSKEIAEAILANANLNNIPLPLAFSLAWIESRYDPNALNRNNSSIDRGLFQLNSNSFPHLSKAEFFSINTNAKHGLSYLRYCISMGKSDIVALAMYNAGPARVKESTPYATLKYVVNILDYRQKLASKFIENMLPMANVLLKTKISA
jgi:soluble lytic murein transglycosylase-like protein